MDLKVSIMMKNMIFFIGIGLGRYENGVVTFPDFKGQVIRHGLGYEPIDGDDELRDEKRVIDFIKEKTLAYPMMMSCQR